MNAPVNRLILAVSAFVLAALAAGCTMTRSVEVQQPLSVRPSYPQQGGPAATQGAIYRSAAYTPLFEDRRARNVGDTLTININEKLDASKTSASNATRKGGMEFTMPLATLGSQTLKGGSISGDSGTTFAGKGDSAANNVFTGAITVTVIEVLPNGNLLVAGEKQIGINQGSEFIRLSGVVNPIQILAGNVVSSTQVADARLEYRGTGYIDEAQTMGWLSRVFLSVMPF